LAPRRKAQLPVDRVEDRIEWDAPLQAPVWSATRPLLEYGGPSPRRYDPKPTRWEYPAGAWVLKVGRDGKVKAKGRNWKINKALAGEWVQLVHTEHRWMVFCCSTLVREIDPLVQCSTIVEHWTLTAKSDSTL
jgi:hypothetical protein